jgi:hypothetical protein
MGPDDDEAEEEELQQELSDPDFGKDEVIYYDHEGRKKEVSPYSWGENGC